MPPFFLMFIFRIPKQWCHCLISSSTVKTFQPCTILYWFTTIKLTGKHAQLFYRHQSTSRLTFKFCCAISAVQGKVGIKPSLIAFPTSRHFLQADYQSGWGKTSGHHSQHLPQAFGHHHFLTNWFFFFHYRQWLHEQILTPLYRCGSVGHIHQSYMGVTWLLPSSQTVPGAHNHTNTVDCPLPGRGLGGCGKAPTGYGIHFDSAKPSHWVWTGLWPNSCLSASLPSLPTHSGRCNPEADVAGWQRPQLAICLCTKEWHCGPCAFV